MLIITSSLDTLSNNSAFITFNTAHVPRMASPIKTKEGNATHTVWQADIRSPSPTSSVEEQDGTDRTDGEDEVNANGKRGKKDRLWFEASLRMCPYERYLC